MKKNEHLQPKRAPQEKREGLHRSPFSYSCRISYDTAHPDPFISREILGGKGLGLRELDGLGLSVPPGFILTTQASREFVAAKGRIPAHIESEIWSQLALLEKATGQSLGNAQKPLFVSARSGAAVSMPGAMDTLLNLGITDDTVETLAQHIGRETAYRSYLLLIIAFAVSVYGVPKEAFSAAKNVEDAKRIFERATKASFPQDAKQQLSLAIQAVFRSWDSKLAKTYRKTQGISDQLGTAVIVQKMVWGNSAATKKLSGSGVLLTHPETHFENHPAVEFAPAHQGTEVVGDGNHYKTWGWNELPPELREELARISHTLEERYHWPQDVEVTVENGKLWVLQTRNARLSTIAELGYHRTISYPQGWMTIEQIARKLDPAHLRSLLVPDLDSHEKKLAEQKNRLIAQGMTITQGNATGELVRSVAEAKAAGNRKIIFCGTSTFTQETLLEIQGMNNLVGIVAESGSLGSHLSRTAIHLGIQRQIPIILGLRMTANGAKMRAGMIVTIDGNEGKLYEGVIARDSNGQTSITKQERIDIETLLQLRHDNPWLFLAGENEANGEIERAKQLNRRAKKAFSSPKAHETALMELFPEEMRIEYTPLAQRHIGGKIERKCKEELRQRLHTVLRSGKFDVTVRTCHTPPRAGGSPWALLTDESMIEKFLSDPDYGGKHGGYQRWILDPELTEIIVGKIPKDKLAVKESIQKQHCAWTLSPTEVGAVLQISPFTSQMRSFETGTGDEFITIEATIDRTTGRLVTETPFIGTTLLGRDKKASHEFAQLVGKCVLQDWWEKYALATRVAAVGTVLNRADGFSVPVLEGQARVENGTLLWCKMYGLKIDQQKKSPPETR